MNNPITIKYSGKTGQGNCGPRHFTLVQDRQVIHLSFEDAKDLAETLQFALQTVLSGHDEPSEFPIPSELSPGNMDFPTLYKGHEILIDHTGNFLTIDGVSHVREWHNTDIEDALVFAKGWIDACIADDPSQLD